ncbi:hypothetical protein UFOVP230_50 [uncultured Caudovirales phage]|uniref:Uncharacterized protein n=1 Tax=uncultured Caudovirales phage TaxID=2100421 RepID=A0A6J7XQ81_9CAUD|nr:hypothetical protein UFOVP230_50 [uncultured Caudovirales phage]
MNISIKWEDGSIMKFSCERPNFSVTNTEKAMLHSVHVTTPPVKEITDEEIKAIARNTYLWNQGKHEWSEVDFARAILRKVQEK